MVAAFEDGEPGRQSCSYRQSRAFRVGSVILELEKLSVGFATEAMEKAFRFEESIAFPTHELVIPQRGGMKALFQ